MIQMNIYTFKIKQLNDAGVVVIYDCPYRKLFKYDNDLFDVVGKMENVIVCESFSKSLGISGARLGFVWSLNDDFNNDDEYYDEDDYDYHEDLEDEEYFEDDYDY